VLSPKAQGSLTVGYFKSEQEPSMYAFKWKVGSGEITYINVYPVINAIEQGDNKSRLYGILGELFNPLDLSLEPFMYTSPPLWATFSYLRGSGSVDVNSSSVIFPLSVDFKRVEIVDSDGSSVGLVNVTKLALSDYNNVHLSASNMTFGDGKGFYSKLTFNGYVTITMESGARVLASTANGNTTEFGRIVTLTIEGNDPVILFMREPTIEVRGDAFFKELYSSETRTQGQDLKVHGTVRLSAYMSDVYSWASWLDVSGFLERNPPVLSYDEFSSLPQAALWGLVLLPSFLFGVLMTRRRTMEA
jgi:hypothetical protein